MILDERKIITRLLACVFCISLLLMLTTATDSHFLSESFVAGAVALASNGDNIDLTNGLVFSPWGKASNLVLQKINDSSFRVQGHTGIAPSGFFSQSFDYQGKFISIVIGNVVKSPSSSRISLSFDIKGLFKDYRLIFTNGPVQAGWTNTTYYHSLAPHSTNLVNLPAIVGNANGLYLLVKKITVVIDGQTTINPLEFKLEFKAS